MSSTTTVIPDLVLNIFFDKSGQTWLATDGGGLYIYRGKRQVERITFQSIGNDEINLNSVRAFWEDDQEILWLGTYQGGVCYIELNPVKKFDQFNQDPYNINSLSYSAVSAIYEDSDGNLWIGTDGGGLDFYNTKTHKYKQIKLHNDLEFLIRGDRVLTINEDKSGNIWVGGYLPGLKKVEPKSGKVTTFLHNPDNPVSQSNNDVRHIFINDDIWNETGASLSVTILPAWYNTWIFRITLIAPVLVLITLMYFYRINLLKKHQIILEQMVEEHTQEVNKKNEQLSRSNELLQERQQQIENQTKKLMTQKETLEEVNQHLKDLNSTKDKFFSIIAHDLRNPFNSILGISEILTRRFDSLTEEKKKKYTDIIYVSSKNVFGLLQNLLDWARSQTDNIKIEPSAFQMVPLIKENMKLVSELANTKGVECILLNGIDIADVYADKNMISTIIRNLLTNAIKFSNPGDKVEVVITQHNGNLQLEIRDQGIGIDKSDIEKLFCVDKNISRQGTLGEMGTGLGLILCKEYIEKNKGSIWVKSEEGHGSSFYIQLPLYREKDLRV